jgi:hypothetical protein
VPHVIREQRIRQRLNWFHTAQELRLVMQVYCFFFGISRKTCYKWWNRYAASARGSAESRGSIPAPAPTPPTDRDPDGLLAPVVAEHFT